MKKNTPPAKPVNPATLDTSTDGEGRVLDVGSDDKKKELELSAELEHSDGPRRVAIQQEVKQADDKSGNSNTTDPVRRK